MSIQGETLRHPVNGTPEQTWNGFSWPAFLLGVFWLLAKGLYGHFVINLLAIVITFGFAAPIVWIAYGIMGNEIHKKSLLKKGYLTDAQWNARNPEQMDGLAPRILVRETNEMAALQASLAPKPPASVADELRKLADLRKDGVLTEEEFAQQKGALLGQAMSSSITPTAPSPKHIVTTGLCPNCDAEIPISSAKCPKCGADFASGSAWPIRPRPQHAADIESVARND